MILLDTCAAIWAVTGDRSLKKKASAAISDAAAHKQLCLSPITAWEIATLSRRGRLTLAISPTAFIDRLFGRPDVIEVPIDRAVASTAGALLDEFHGDPADRFIVATAILTGFRLATRDERIIAYATRSGTFPVLAC